MEQLSNNGYLAVKKQTTEAAVIPDTYLSLYDEDLTTKLNLDEDNPIAGNRFARFQNFMGMRSHSGNLTLLADPNTAALAFDMLLTKGTSSAGPPYTHPFTLADTSPKSYTIDIQRGGVVCRYIGAQIGEISNSFDKNKMLFKCKVSALKSFIVREVQAVTGAISPWNIELKTDYDPSPTTGLVVGDIMTLIKANGTKVNFAVASIVDGTHITTTTDVSSGVITDLIYIRAATPSYALETPFMWARTEFCFGADAAAALAAAQTRIDEGKWTISNKFEGDEGAQRSGSFDPAALVRLQGDIQVDLKQFFDTPTDLNRFFANTKRALVIRHFSETGFELRITINNVHALEHELSLKSGEIIYAEPKLVGVYDASDGQAFDVKVISTINL